jgi:hypothetical protein
MADLLPLCADAGSQRAPSGALPQRLPHSFWKSPIALRRQRLLPSINKNENKFHVTNRGGQFNQGFIADLDRVAKEPRL